MDGPMENPLRAGIVGCGHWARDAYLPTLVIIEAPTA
jgi:predicted dehydrogenase